MSCYNFRPCTDINQSKICHFLKDREKFYHIHNFSDEDMFEYDHPEFDFSKAIIYDFGEETAKRIAETLLGSLKDYDGR